MSAVRSRLHDGEQGVQGAVGVPQGEDGVVGESVGGVDVLVQAAVAAVDVLVDHGAEHGVVEGRVEDRLPVVVQGLDSDPAQLAVPGGAGLGPGGVEVPAGSLGGQVGQGAGPAHRRQGHLDLQLLAGLHVEIEVGADLAAGHLGEVVLLVEAAPEAPVGRGVQALVAVGGERLAEGDGEVDGAGAGPAGGHAPAGDQRVVLHPHEGPHVLARVVVDVGREVQQHPGRTALAERVTVAAGAGGGGQLDADAVVVQRDRVIAGLGGLGGVAEARHRRRGQVHLPQHRQQRDVAQVRMPGAAEVGVAEAGDGAVGILVAGTVAVDLRS